MTEFIIVWILFIFLVGIFLGFAFPLKRLRKVPQVKTKEKSIYSKPVLKPLTAEQIKNIHLRGKITPAEMLKEWESFELCAPGDAIGSASWRCKKFNYCCHDCLVDYANQHDEYTSIFKIMEETMYSIKINND